MFYCPVHMTIEWEDLSMPTDGCSMCMPIMFINSKFWCAKQDSDNFTIIGREDHGLARNIKEFI